MNKQEVIEKLQSEAIHHCGEKECYKDGCTKNVELDIAIDIVNQIDEPEKPILTKEEAEWLEGLKEARSKLPKIQLIYFIVRQGWGYLFEYKEGYEEANHVLKPQLYPDEVYPPDLKERLLNAVLYGYEVEKEKLYTARLEIIDNERESYINKDTKTDEIFLDDLTGLDGKFQVNFTQAELEELNVWDNPAFEVEEMEDD